MKGKQDKTLTDTKYHKGIQSYILQFHCHLQSRLRVYCYSNQAEWVQFLACLLCNMSIFKKEQQNHCPYSHFLHMLVFYTFIRSLNMESASSTHIVPMVRM